NPVWTADTAPAGTVSAPAPTVPDLNLLPETDPTTVEQTATSGLTRGSTAPNIAASEAITGYVLTPSDAAHRPSRLKDASNTLTDVARSLTGAVSTALGGSSSAGATHAATLAASAALGAVFLWLMASQASSRPLTSRVCLPPVPPG